MQAAGIITEYNLLHYGHLYQMARTRELLGPDCGIVCVMSGNFVQRGDFAAVRKHVRAAAAVKSGADLVLELPLPWAVASAERFADGGVQTLLGTGLVTHLSFGSESGDATPLRRVAAALCDPSFPELLRGELAGPVGFAAARQRAAEHLLAPEDAALLSRPNDILGIEYCKSLLRRSAPVIPLAIPRRGVGHDAAAEGDSASASAIRRLLEQGERARALSLMAPAMAEGFLAEEQAGRAPVFGETCQRAVLARLRTMRPEEFLALDGGNEGLGNRFYEAARTAPTLEKLLDAVKTRRYAYSRLRRMALWAYLGLRPENFPERVPYLRVLAANAAGCALLARMRETATLPVLTKPADVRRLPPEARELFALEVRAADLYTLAYPRLAAAEGGGEWREGPAILI